MSEQVLHTFSIQSFIHAGDALRLGAGCDITVTSATKSSGTYLMSFTLSALTAEQRNSLTLNGESVSLLGPDMISQIELGGYLAASGCFSPVTVGARFVFLSSD